MVFQPLKTTTQRKITWCDSWIVLYMSNHTICMMEDSNRNLEENVLVMKEVTMHKIVSFVCEIYLVEKDLHIQIESFFPLSI